MPFKIQGPSWWGIPTRRRSGGVEAGGFSGGVDIAAEALGAEVGPDCFW